MKVDIDFTPYSETKYWLKKCDTYDGAYDLFKTWYYSAQSALEEQLAGEPVGDVEDLRCIATVFVKLVQKSGLVVSCQDLMTFWYCCSRSQFVHNANLNQECHSAFARAVGAGFSVLASLEVKKDPDHSRGEKLDISSITDETWYSKKPPTAETWDFYDSDTIDKPISGQKKQIAAILNVDPGRLSLMHPNQAWIQRIHRTEYRLWHSLKRTHLEAYCRRRSADESKPQIDPNQVKPRQD